MATDLDTRDLGNESSAESRELIPSSDEEREEGNRCSRCLKRSFRRLKNNDWRNLIGFWILGLCNNFPYVIMLSAAYDIIHKIEGNFVPTFNGTVLNQSASACAQDNYTFFHDNGEISKAFTFLPRKCHFISTGAILLADILPTLIIKLVCPWWMDKVPFWIRVLICTVASVASFILVAAFEQEAVIIFGVVCASIGSGFGEIVFLSFTSHFDKSTVSAWSSGTGAAGIGASMVYLVLTSLAGLSPTITLYLQTVVPLVLLVTFIFIIKRPNRTLWCPCLGKRQYSVVRESNAHCECDRSATGDHGDGKVESSTGAVVKGKFKSELFPESEDEAPLCPAEEPSLADKAKERSVQVLKVLRHRLKLIIPLLWFMIPLFAVYVGEYLINQGLFELIYYPNTRGVGTTCFGQSDQYRWYQAVYQMGVFISRSSVNIFSTRHVWIFAVLQLLNFAFFFCEAVFTFLPSFWLMIFLVFLEGFFGGATYVNAFYHIAKEMKSEDKEFAMGISSISDTFGITVAGVSSIYVHNFICSNYVPAFTKT